MNIESDISQNFREAMSRLGAAVTVLTTDGPAGRHGMTASAVCSVTDNPPTVLVCVNTQNRSHDLFVENGAVCINVLTGEHKNLSAQFARSGEASIFDTAEWTTHVTGAPALIDASVVFDCHISERSEVGTHSVFFCEIKAIKLAEGEPRGLIWFGREFHSLSATG